VSGEGLDDKKNILAGGMILHRHTHYTDSARTARYGSVKVGGGMDIGWKCLWNY
jgi:hypothetical protein